MTTPSPDPTVADVLTPEVRARLGRSRDAFYMTAENRALDERVGLYYCIRCHRHHYRLTAIGRRHAGRQPEPLR